MRVIWAYHHEDVGAAGPKYHNSNRGTKSLRLLNPEKTNVLSTAVPYFDLVNQDVPIPNKGTTYWCQMFKIPVLQEKHHVIKVEPVIQRGHESLVHHILLYQCSSNFSDSVMDFGHECYHPNMPDAFLTCETVIFAWAIGGEALEAEKPSGIHVFAVLLHAHLAGRGIRLRHFRKGEEMRLLAYDDNFDFNFQEFQYLKEEQTILPGDNLITECRYNTKDRARMTWGGLSTRNEMCLSYLLYYPRINLTRCASIPDIMEQLQFIGVKEIYRPVTTWPFIIKSPKQYKNLSFMDAMNKFKWTKKEGLAFNKLVLSLPVNVRCSKTDNAEWSVDHKLPIPLLLKKEIYSKAKVGVKEEQDGADKAPFISLFPQRRVWKSLRRGHLCCLGHSAHLQLLGPLSAFGAAPIAQLTGLPKSRGHHPNGTKRSHSPRSCSRAQKCLRLMVVPVPEIHSREQVMSSALQLAIMLHRQGCITLVERGSSCHAKVCFVLHNFTTTIFNNFKVAVFFARISLGFYFKFTTNLVLLC
ncbi:monooxygenase, DBH-like protein [Camelus ferus]|nr:monooxygenase, DBH-like protein [Camelus ferus]